MTILKMRMSFEGFLRASRTAWAKEEKGFRIAARNGVRDAKSLRRLGLKCVQDLSTRHKLLR